MGGAALEAGPEHAASAKCYFPLLLDTIACYNVIALLKVLSMLHISYYSRIKILVLGPKAVSLKVSWSETAHLLYNLRPR